MFPLCFTPSDTISTTSSITPSLNTTAAAIDQSADNFLIVATLNIRGQTGLDFSKQKQIEAFIKLHSVDILHCQEIEIQESTFETCNFITSSFEIIQNNSPNNKYGTASLVRNELTIENINLDTN